MVRLLLLLVHWTEKNGVGENTTQVKGPKHVAGKYDHGYNKFEFMMTGNDCVGAECGEIVSGFWWVIILL